MSRFRKAFPPPGPDEYVMRVPRALVHVVAAFLFVGCAVIGSVLAYSFLIGRISLLVARDNAARYTEGVKWISTAAVGPSRDAALAACEAFRQLWQARVYELDPKSRPPTDPKK